MNILFPIAGRGQRFKVDDYTIPKPLVMVHGKTLLEHAISTLKLEGQYIFVSLRYDNPIWNTKIQEIITTLQPDSEIILLDEITNGMAETCLYAQELIDTNEELIITNVDQILSWDPNTFLKFVHTNNSDACVSTYDHQDIEVGKPSKYAFVKLDKHGNATEFREKFAISEHAMNGIYYWKHGNDFVKSAKAMIRDNVTVNGEFYVSPSYNYLIQEQKKIHIYKMNDDEFYSLGSPDEIRTTTQRTTIQPESNMKTLQKFKQVLADIHMGKPVVVVDDYDREFEGDIVLSAEKATVENLIFAMKHAKGLMCLPILQPTCDRLQIPMMPSNQNDKYGTPFTVSIDAVEGTTTGMSVYDRLKTISVLLNEHSRPSELSQPGHLFPLRAKPGLLQERRGHTEASIELMQAARLKPIAVIIEIMNDDGTMTKGEQLAQYARIYNLNIISVEEIYDAVYQ